MEAASLAKCNGAKIEQTAWPKGKRPNAFEISSSSSGLHFCVIHLIKVLQK